MPGRITINNRIIQGVGITVQALGAGVVDRIRRDEAGQGGVVVAGAVVHEAAGILLFAGVGVGRGVDAAAVFGFRAKGDVGPPPDFIAVAVREAGRALEVIGMIPGTRPVRVPNLARLRHTYAVDGVVFCGGRGTQHHQ